MINEKAKDIGDEFNAACGNLISTGIVHLKSTGDTEANAVISNTDTNEHYKITITNITAEKAEEVKADFEEFKKGE